MNELRHSAEPEARDVDEATTLGHRLHRGMCWTIALAVLLSAAFASWRVTTGLLLGGLLSLFNYHWLRTSVMAILGGTMSAEESRQRIMMRFIARYFVVAAIVGAAAFLDVVSLAATIIGLCAFAVAAMIEASVQMYAAIAHREKF